MDSARSDPRFPDLAEAERWISTEFGPVEGVELAGQGAWSRAFGFVHNGLELIARFGPHLDDFRADTLAAQWAAPDLPIPRVHLLTRTPVGHLIVTDRCRGGYLEELDQAGWIAVIPALLTALDRLRAIAIPGDVHRAAARADVPSETLFGLDQTWQEVLLIIPDSGPGARLAGWRDRLHADAAALECFTDGLTALRQLSADLVVERSVVHGDLINRNAMAVGDQLTGVFDWGCMMAGDPLYEIAWLEFWRPWTPGLAQIDIVECAREHYRQRGHSLDNFDRRLRVACLKIGVDHLVYNAFTADATNLAGTMRRMADYL